MASSGIGVGPQGPRRVETTHWKVVLEAGGGSREALAEEVAQTVDPDDDIQEELRFLREVLRPR